MLDAKWCLEHSKWPINGIYNQLIGKIFNGTTFSKIVKRDVLYSASTESLSLLFSPPGELWYFTFCLSKVVLNRHHQILAGRSELTHRERGHCPWSFTITRGDGRLCYSRHKHTLELLTRKKKSLKPFFFL